MTGTRIAPLLEGLGEIAAARGKTRAQVAINWCLAKGTLPIPGAKTGAQARENAGALGWALTRGRGHAARCGRRWVIGIVRGSASTPRTRRGRSRLAG
jgi:aryl-alcohol dehydrogenase-like predicted oxidoreductase